MSTSLSVAVLSGAEIDERINRMRNLAGLLNGYRNACKGGAVLYPGDFFEYPEQLQEDADAMLSLLAQLREARKDSARALTETIEKSDAAVIDIARCVGGWQVDRRTRPFGGVTRIGNGDTLLDAFLEAFPALSPQPEAHDQ